MTTPLTPGSFFNFFELKSDPYEVSPPGSQCVRILIYVSSDRAYDCKRGVPEAVNYFLDQGNDDDIDSDDSDDEDDDDDA